MWPVGAAPAALRAGGRDVAGGRFRAGGGRGRGPPPHQLALRCSERPRAGEEPAALQEVRLHLPDRLREPRAALRLPWRCDLRPLPRPRPRGLALLRHRLPAGHPLLPRKHRLSRCGVRHRRPGGELLPHEPPERSEVPPGGVRLGQSEFGRGGLLAAGTAPDPDLLRPGGQNHPGVRGRGVRAAQPPQRTPHLQGCRPPPPRPAGGDLQPGGAEVPLGQEECVVLSLAPEREHDMVSSASVKPSIDRKHHWRAGVILAGSGVTLFVFILYLRTLAPTILPYDSPDLLDVPMLQMQVCVLGMTHPTGYPSYLMLSHLFTYLPFGDCAYRANLASATYAALAVSVLFAAGYLLSGRVVAAAAAALAFGLGVTLWSQAVIAEVYTLNALFVALTLLTLLFWREYGKKERYLLVCAFLVGLSMTDHLTSGLLLPASVLFVGLVEWRKLVEGRLLLKGVGLFLVGLTPYLYLPIRSAMDPPFGSKNPTSLGGFWRLISGGNLRGGFFAFGPAELPERLAFYWGHLLDNFHWGLVAAGMVGMVALILWDRALALLLGFLFSGWLLFAIENDIPDIQLYFIPTYLVLSLWIAVGFGLVLEGVESLISRLRRISKPAALGAFSVALVLLPLVSVGKSYARNDMSHDYH